MAPHGVAIPSRSAARKKPLNLLLMPGRSLARAAALCCLVLVTSWLVPAQPAPPPQADAPLLRTFKAGDVQRYRVELTVRTSADGQRARQVGSKTYAEKFSESSSGAITWHATRRVLSVQPDGSAEIEETLDEFSAQEAEGRLQQELHAALREWSQGQPLTLRYREARNGQIAGLAAQGGPVLDQDPPVLTLWLRRALRPSAALPARAPRAGDKWNEARRVQLPPWNNLMGSEEFAWLEASSPPASGARLLNLHSVQQISSPVPVQAEEGPHWLGRFHGESVSTLVHAGAPLYGGYGSLHSAVRSGTRETTHVGERIPTLADLPVFRARTAAEVRIQVLE
jgi:hypothetical protein